MRTRLCLQRCLLRVAGFTLTEMLVTTLILVLVSTLMATGIPAAIDTYQKVVMTSNAQMALSTTLSELRGELGLATRVEVKSTGGEPAGGEPAGGEPAGGEPAGGETEGVGTTQYTVYYYSSSEGCWVSIGNDTGENPTYRGLVKQYLLGMPTSSVTVDKLDKDGSPVPLVSNDAITDNLHVLLTNASRPDGIAAVDVVIEVKDAADNTLASVGVEGSGFRILTRFLE